LPNLNEAIHDLGGHLLPLGWARLLWRLRVRARARARLLLFGLTADWRGARGLGLTALLLTELHDRSAAAGYLEWEMSWVLEDNRPASQGALALGARRAAVYRIYETDLTT